VLAQSTLSPSKRVTEKKSGGKPVTLSLLHSESLKIRDGHRRENNLRARQAQVYASCDLSMLVQRPDQEYITTIAADSGGAARCGPR
jgi:hypothetical protein